MKYILHIIYTLSLLAFLIGQAEAQKPTEYEVKAAFLFNFARFVEWPDEAFASPKSPLVIGILGRDPFGSVLDQTVQQKTVRERSFIVRRFKSAQDIQGCHLLFIAASEQHRLNEHLKHIGEAPILTISEIEGFCQNGGMINFVLIQNLVRFQINPNAAIAAHLKMSSKLLKLAILVSNQQPKEAP